MINLKKSAVSILTFSFSVCMFISTAKAEPGAKSECSPDPRTPVAGLTATIHFTGPSESVLAADVLQINTSQASPRRLGVKHIQHLVDDWIVEFAENRDGSGLVAKFHGLATSKRFGLGYIALERLVEGKTVYLHCGELTRIQDE